MRKRVPLVLHKIESSTPALGSALATARFVAGPAAASAFASETLHSFHAAQSLHALGVDAQARTAQERRDPPIAIPGDAPH